MKKLNLLLIFFFCSLINSALFAQTGKLNGIISDEKSKPVGYANVVLFRAADTVLTEAVITDETGKFLLKGPSTGSYFLRVNAIGFNEFSTAVFEVKTVPFSKDFGSIKLKENTKTLKEVQVQALRPTIVQEADRMVVSVAGTALAAGNTAYEVLAKAPGVFIDQEGNIQLNGRSGVTIMLDGKLTYLSARDLRTLLEGMPAENLKNIEIITNPAAKYDAEGSSGILNINLKKNETRGMNGSMYTNYRFNKFHGYSFGGNLNQKTNRWDSFLSLDMARRVWGREATFTRVFYATEKTTYFDQVATEEGIRYAPSLRLGTDFSLNKMHTIGFMANVTYQNTKNEFLTETLLVENPQQPNEFIDANNFSKGTFLNYTTNLHYVGKPDTLGTTLTADLDLVQITNNSEGEFKNYFYDLTSGEPAIQDFLLTDIPAGYDIIAAKTDYITPFLKDGKLEAGAKASRVVSRNRLDFYFNNGPVPVLDPNRTDRFNYYENIFAAYLNGKKKLSEQFDVQAGLRAEQTLGTGESMSTGKTTKRNYLDWFPSIFVQHNITENYNLNYNYSRRIQRPNYGNLNPFIFYRDPYTWIQGNPYLRPQYTHQFGFTQTFKKQYSLALNYQLHKDFISELPDLNVDDATTVYYTGNVDDSQNISLTANAPLKILKFWDTNNTLVASYSDFRMVVNGEKINNNQLFYQLQSNQNILLPQNIKLELNFGYRGPGAYGLYQIDKQWWLHVAVKKTFLNDKLDLSINANDIFKSQRLRFATDIAGNINEFDQYFLNRSIGITVRYNFSRGQKFDSKRLNSNLDELNRT